LTAAAAHSDQDTGEGSFLRAKWASQPLG